jgi:hypothetical protein
MEKKIKHSSLVEPAEGLIEEPVIIEGSDLDALLNFANSNPQGMIDEALMGLIYSYVSLRFEEKVGSKFLGFGDLFSRFTEGLIPVESRQVVEEKRRFFQELRDHLSARLETIIEASHSGQKQPVFAVEGSMGTEVTADGERFIQLFRVLGDHPLGKLDVELEKKKLDAVLSAAVEDLALKPNRFRKCLTCGRFFYQHTLREKRYCSPKCGGSFRKQKFMEGKRKGGGSEKEKSE